MAVEVPDRGDLVDRIRILVATAATHDPGRADLRPEAVAACGRVLVATVVDGLPAAADGRIPRLRLPGSSVALPGTIAGRLWSRLARGRPTAELLAVLNAALVLLVDHGWPRRRSPLASPPPSALIRTRWSAPASVP